MPAAVSRYRAFLLITSLVLFPVIFIAFLVAEKPGLGLGHFYYIPVAMIALACGPAWGAVAGAAATGIYALGVVINPHLPPRELLTTSSSIRLFTYTTIGILIGWFAHNNRELVDRLRSAEEHDFLTGLLNTRAFDAALSARVELGHPFGLILGDMDGLKEVNDTEGHAVGNDLLRRAAELLRRRLGTATSSPGLAETNSP